MHKNYLRAFTAQKSNVIPEKIYNWPMSHLYRRHPQVIRHFKTNKKLVSIQTENQSEVTLDIRSSKWRRRTELWRSILRRLSPGKQENSRKFCYTSVNSIDSELWTLNYDTYSRKRWSVLTRGFNIFSKINEDNFLGFLHDVRMLLQNVNNTAPKANFSRLSLDHRSV